MAHLGGVSVEGELGVLGSLETGMGEKEDGHGAEGKLGHDQLLTDPDAGRGLRQGHQGRRAGHRHRHQPRRLQVHAQAGRRRAGDERIEEIHRRLPNTHLVMHGSSSVPQDLQDVINKYGGKMQQT